jgi:RNA polymerase-binding transcription factor DksA
MANDIVDIAQEFIVDQNLVASQTISTQLDIQRNLPSEEFCLDCDLPIPQLRRDMGGITHCVECQTLLEKYPTIRFDSRGKVIKQFIDSEY